VDGPREAEIAFRLRRADPVEIDVPSAMGADLVARLGGDERSTTSGAAGLGARARVSALLIEKRRHHRPGPMALGFATNEILGLITHDPVSQNTLDWPELGAR
jgi:hypothetical protein